MEEPLLASVVANKAKPAIFDQALNRAVRHVVVTSAGRRRTTLSAAESSSVPRVQNLPTLRQPVTRADPSTTAHQDLILSCGQLNQRRHPASGLSSPVAG